MKPKKSLAKNPRILYVTCLNKGSSGFGYLNGFRNMGLTVLEVDTSAWLGNWTFSFWERIAFKIRRGRLPKNVIFEMNRAIIEAADELQPDLTFFVGAPFILPETLQYTRRYGLNFCQFNDDMFNPVCRTYTFFDCLPYWDCIFVTRQCNIEEYQSLGVSRVAVVPFAYTPGLHRPVQPNREEYEKYRGDVAFIGSFISPARADYLAEIIYQCPNVKFNIWGGGWNMLKRPHYWIKPRRWRTWPYLLKAKHNYPLFYDEMSKAMNSHKIVIGLLNHHNRDLNTTRTFEIPACGAFMLAERTSEHLEMFEEGTEAEYFDSAVEASSKIKYYLTYEEERKRIAQAGNRRLLTSDYSYFDRARTAMEQYKAIKHEQNK